MYTEHCSCISPEEVTCDLGFSEEGWCVCEIHFIDLQEQIDL